MALTEKLFNETFSMFKLAMCVVVNYVCRHLPFNRPKKTFFYDDV